MNRPLWFVFAGGGTGGHLFPALAVVDELRAMAGDAGGDASSLGPIDVSFYCTHRPIDGRLLGAAGVEAIPQPVLPFSSRPWHWLTFWLRWRESVTLCRRAFMTRRPVLVVGAGGYASGPAVHAATSLGIPTFLLNPDAVPGRANRYLARRGGLAGIFAQWAVTRDHLPASTPVEVTGCPVRAVFHATHKAVGFSRFPSPEKSPGQGIVKKAHSIEDGRVAGNTLGIDEFKEKYSVACQKMDEIHKVDRDTILRSFSLDPGLRTLLVTGASQGARTINETMMALAGELDFTGWQVLHLAGEADMERVADAYAVAAQRGGGAFRGKVLAFTDRMADAMTAADLIVSRAGASTLAEILAVGRASILLPYPYMRDQHQRHNAMVLVEAGVAVMIDDGRRAEVNRKRLGPVLVRLLKNDVQRNAMAEAAARLGRPEAASMIARRLVEAARTRCESGCEFLDAAPVKTLSRHTA